MKKEKSLEQLDHSSPWLEDHAIPWISQYGKMLALGIAALFVLCIVLLYSGANSSYNAAASYVKAEQAFQKFQDSPNKETLQTVNSYLAQSDLQTKYDGSIAETLLIQKNLQAAQPYVDRTFQRVSSFQIPEYLSFAKTTPVIISDQPKTALKEAVTLKETLLTQPTDSSKDILFAFNLLRIAFLEQAIGSPQDELMAWQEWKFYAGWEHSDAKTSPFSPNAFAAVAQHFSEQQLTLADYITDRERQLGKKL